MYIPSLLPYVASLSALISSAHSEVAYPLSTSSRWVVDSNGDRFKLRCVNWAGHLEPGVPEGLSKQPVDKIAVWIASNDFNCVRLTYSIDMALAPNISVSDSFTQAANSSGTNTNLAALQAQYSDAVAQNPFLSTATRLSTFETVIATLASHSISVVLDNHVSKAQWCCNSTDGNGWWDTASGYTASNSQWFNTTDWLAGLSAMSAFSTTHSNIVGMSLRNELRAVGSQDSNNHADWYSLMTQGAQAIHAGNPNLLIVFGGVTSATDLSYLQSTPLDTSAWPDKTVFEFHSYYWSFPVSSSVCAIYDDILGARTGFVLEQDRPFTAPLWLSEFGATQVIAGAGGNLLGDAELALEQAYLKCLVGYMEGNDADWALWALQGGYYVREGVVDADESYGLLDHAWGDWRNATFKSALGGMFGVTQGPGV
ncbi:MAG: hypothetical protein LQ340_002887 [Diploschistes diacapsis]|nr:MAG: hypothetical protein LQ340_002887 [Diploschistes diacapsis]